MKKGIIIALLLTLTACTTRGCVESRFHLSQESRLPAWFEKPADKKRSDIDVVLEYYTNGTSDITFYDISGSIKTKITKFQGVNERHPAYVEWANKDWPARSHPAYVVIVVNGVKEIVEHKRMEPVFYMSSEFDVQKTISGENAYNKSLKTVDALKRAP